MGLPRLHPRRRATRAGARRPSTPGFNPASVTAVSVWYRNKTVGALSTYPDVLGGAAGIPGPAGAGHFPTGNADYSVSFDGGDDIRVALAAPNNNATTWGFGVWVKASLSSQQTLYNAQVSSGASGVKCRIDVLANGTVSAVTLPSGAAASSVGALVANTAAFVSVEFNGNRAAGSRFKFFVNGVDVTASDSSPASITAPTGNSELFAQDAGGGGTSFIGSCARNFYFYASEEVGSTSGLLTAASRAALATVDPLP